MPVNEQPRQARARRPWTSHARTSDARLVAVLVVSSGLAVDGTAGAWDPLKSAGQSLVAGARSELQPLLASTVADVDKRATALATQVINQANGAVAARLDQTDNILEKQILHVQVAAQGVVGDALTRVDDISHKRLVEAGAVAKGAISQLDKAVAKNLDAANDILRDRTRDLSAAVGQALDRADQVLSDRIRQIDEVAGRRLANVDVIVTKQRAGMEETLVRVAVLVGLLVFVVFVVIRLWREYQVLSPKLRDTHGLPYLLELASSLGQPLLRQIFAAGLATVLFIVLYNRLPLSARDETKALIARHSSQMEESLNRLEYAEVRFHASQLEMLVPPDAQRYRALAAKADALEQFLGRPTLLSTPQGIRTAVDKTAEIERLLGDQIDPDVLVLKAAILWQVGTARRDEHEAASLCARAVRIGRGGFALQPIAVNLLRSFLGSPYVAAGTPLGRDAEAVPDLQIALGLAGEPRQGFPLERVTQLDGLIRNLDRASSRAYVQMAEAHADVVRLRLDPARPRDGQGAPRTLKEAKALRLRRAKEVITAWKSFDAAVQAVPGLQGSPEVLSLFRLNDAVWTRALWFIQDPDASETAPLLGELADSRANLELKVVLAPPRVAWARRYAALLDGPARTLIELQEANRYRTYERISKAFEKALIETFASDATAQIPPASSKEAALEAARLGLFVDSESGHRFPYALALLRRTAPRPRAEGGADGVSGRGARAIPVDEDVIAALAVRTLWLP